MVIKSIHQRRTEQIQQHAIHKAPTKCAIDDTQYNVLCCSMGVVLCVAIHLGDTWRSLRDINHVNVAIDRKSVV